MPTVLEQIKAEIAAQKAKAAQDAAIQAQPGPTIAKADLDRDQRIEEMQRKLAGINSYDPSSYGPDLKLLEHGATLGLDVPLSGLASGLQFWGYPGSSFSERYQAGEEARRRRLNISRAEAPLPVAQEIAGGLLSAGPAGAAESWALEQGGARAWPAAQQSILRTAAEAGGVGAGTGAIHGVATGEGDWHDRLIPGGTEGLVGGIGGALLGAGVRAIQPNVAPAIARQTAADEFDIPLTRGQATGDIAQQKTEQELIHGARGGTAQ